MGGDIDPNDKLSDFRAFVVAFKCFTGPGMLSLPFALDHSGYAIGLPALVGFACLSIHGIITLVECARTVEAKDGKPAANYTEIALSLVGPLTAKFVSVCVCCAQLAVCIVFVSLISTNLAAVAPCAEKAHLVMDEHTEQIIIMREPDCFGLSPLALKRVMIVMVMPILMALSWLPSIRTLAPLANVANVLMLVTIFLVLFYSLKAFFFVGLADSFVPWPHGVQPFFMFIGNCYYR